MDSKINKIRLAIISLGYNFIAGSLALVLGCCLVEYSQNFNKPVETIVLLGSFMAAGRILGSILWSKVVDYINPVKIEIICLSLVISFLVGMVISDNFVVAIILSFLEGVGFSGNDAFSPLFISYLFKENYSSGLSLGQALYGLGGFAFTFVTYLVLKLELPFYYANYFIVIIAAILLITSFFSKYSRVDENHNETSTTIPLYAKNKILAFVIIAITALAYCAVSNILCTYTSTFGIGLNMSEADGAALVTMFNVGNFIGSIVFIPLLKKISEKTLLVFSCIVGFMMILAFIITGNANLGYICLFVTGFFIGPLYAIILAISTRIGYSNIPLASSVVSAAGGCGDIIVPIITSFVYSNSGIKATYSLSLVVLGITILCSFVIYTVTKEEEV